MHKLLGRLSNLCELNKTAVINPEELCKIGSECERPNLGAVLHIETQAANGLTVRRAQQVEQHSPL